MDKNEIYTHKDKMKKLVALLGMCALANGAWAKVDYTWSVDIYNLDKTFTMPKILQWTLTGVRDGKIFANLSLDMFDFTKYSEDEGYLYTLNKTKADNYASQYNIDTSWKEGGTITLAADAHDPQNKKDLHLSVDFYTDENILTEYGQEGDLQVTLLVSDGQDWKWQYIDAKFTHGQTIGSETKYDPVPEPTSAMLMLLGFAGLALKRKRI